MNCDLAAGTSAPDADQTAVLPRRPPLLPFAPAELDRMAIRMRPADFARLMEVSKQAVSGWIAAGKITLRPDGYLEPREAVRQLLRNSDPGRLRSRLLAPILAQVREAHEREAMLRQQIDTLRRQAAEAAAAYARMAEALRGELQEEKIAVEAENEATGRLCALFVALSHEVADLPADLREARVSHLRECAELDEAPQPLVEWRECLKPREASSGGAGP